MVLEGASIILPPDKQPVVLFEGSSYLHRGPLDLNIIIIGLVLLVVLLLSLGLLVKVT